MRDGLLSRIIDRVVANAREASTFMGQRLYLLISAALLPISGLAKKGA